MEVQGLDATVTILPPEHADEPAMVQVTASTMAQALWHTTDTVSFPVTEVGDISVTEPTNWLEGSVTLQRRSGTVHALTVRFAPGQADAARVLAAALAGDGTVPEQPPRGTFIAVAVSSDDPDWTVIKSVEAVQVTDGEVGEVTQFTAAQLEDFCDFAGENLLIADPAFYHFSVLARAMAAAKMTPPSGPLLCAMAMARHAGADSAHLSADQTAAPPPSTATEVAARVLAAASRWERIDTPTEYGFQPGRFVGDGTIHHVQWAPVAPGEAEPPRPQVTKSRPGRWESVSTPDEIPETNPHADPASPLYGHSVTLTGDFSPWEKGDLWARIAAAGGAIGKNVTKKTTLLVIGAWATITSKEKRARQLIADGQPITLWTMNQLLEALGLDGSPQPSLLDQPPF